MKSIIVGDLHCGVNEQDDNFLKYQLKSLNWIIEEVNKPEIDQVILLGDMFHNRKALSLPSLKLAKWFLSKIKHKLFSVSVGNHDCHYKNTNELNSPSFLLDESYLAEDMIKSKDSLILSWVNESNLDKVVDEIKKSKAKYLFGHFELAGFKMTKGINSQHDQFKREYLDKFKHVISGHYHCFSQRNNITYIGSPYEMNWGDCNESKIIGVLDHTSGDLSYIENPYHYHVKCYIEDDEWAMDSIERMSEQNVKVFINCEQSIKVNKMLEVMGEKIKNLDITDNFMVESLNSDLQIEYTGSVIDLWNEYVETEEIDNKEDIIKIFNEEYRKVVLG